MAIISALIAIFSGCTECDWLFSSGGYKCPYIFGKRARHWDEEDTKTVSDIFGQLWGRILLTFSLLLTSGFLLSLTPSEKAYIQEFIQETSLSHAKIWGKLCAFFYILVGYLVQAQKFKILGRLVLDLVLNKSVNTIYIHDFVIYSICMIFSFLNTTEIK